MSTNDRIDQATGKIKEVAGETTGNDQLAAEGRGQQSVAKAKQAADEAMQKAADGVAHATDRVGEAAKRVTGNGDNK
jgi:uncharacterized protein YjbJ (UPF0337 family)